MLPSATPGSTPGGAKARMPHETFAGKEGDLPPLGKAKAYRKIAFEDLTSRQYDNEGDFEALNVDLGRTTAPKGKAWPLVAPSPELYGSIAGWRVEPTVSARDGVEPETDDRIRDRNVYDAYRWQFSPLHERAAALEARADEMVDSLRQVHPRTTEGMTFGRICPEVDAPRINKASVMLELLEGRAGQSSSGGRLTLDLRETASYSVFSGQVVGIKGVSLREGVVNVTEVASRAPPPPVRVRRNNAEALATLQAEGGPIRVAVATGPYTAPTDLAFDPLNTLLADVLDFGADVLILGGPFVDADHEMMRSQAMSLDLGEGKAYEMDFEAVWVSMVLNILNEYLKDGPGMGLQVVFQPSTSDMIVEPVFPQAPFPPSLFRGLDPQVRERVVCVPNPACFVVGDLLWGMTTADPVFGINSDDASASTDPSELKDRYAFLARHVLDQRSFYPLFPAAMPQPDPKLNGLQQLEQQALRSVPLEVTRTWNLGLPACPDVLVLPSKLGMSQARALGDHTVLINPGQLSVKKTFAKVLIYPDMTVASAESTPGEELVTNKAQQRVRVDNERIVL